MKLQEQQRVQRLRITVPPLSENRSQAQRDYWCWIRWSHYYYLRFSDFSFLEDNFLCWNQTPCHHELPYNWPEIAVLIALDYGDLLLNCPANHLCKNESYFGRFNSSHLNAMYKFIPGDAVHNCSTDHLRNVKEKYDTPSGKKLLGIFSIRLISHHTPKNVCLHYKILRENFIVRNSALN